MKCPNCGSEGPFKYRPLSEDRRTGVVTWGCALCGLIHHEEKMKP